MTNSVADLVGRLEGWCEQAIDGPVGWNEPAAPEAIDALEAELGRSLPAEVRQWLMIRDGQDWPRRSRPVLPAGMSFLSCDGILATWRDLLPFADAGNEVFFEMFQDHDRVRRVVYDRGRIPLAHSEGNPSLMLDLVPGPRGTAGQIIYLYTETDFVVVGENFRDFLARYVGLLESGTFTFEDDSDDDQPFVTVPEGPGHIDEVWRVPPAKAR